MRKSSKEGNQKCIEKIIGIAGRQEKCTKLLVQNVEKKPRFLLNQMAPDPSIVENVTKNVNQEDFSKKD